MIRLLGPVTLGIAIAGAAPAQTPAANPLQEAADSAFHASAWRLAHARYDSLLRVQPDAGPGPRVRAAFAALELGFAPTAIQRLEPVVAAAPDRAPVARAGLAIAYATLGDRGRALDELERAVKAGYANFELLDTHPAFASVRSDPRFAAAREAAERAQMPCRADPAARAFDFWVGDWDVYPNGTSVLVGRNRIEVVSGGCAILENWTARTTPLAGPSEGKSLNFVDPATGKWRQVWMGSGRGQTNYWDGEYRDGALRFVYERTDQAGRQVQGRFIFYNLGPDRVRQYQDQSLDGGKTHQVVYDFLYIRRGSGAPVLPGVR